MKKFYKVTIVCFILFAFAINAIPAQATALQTPIAKQARAAESTQKAPNWLKVLSSFEAPVPKEIIKKRTFKSIPLYNQMDYPDIPFESGTVANSGCGITCMAMVATYLLDEEHLPDELALEYNAPGISNAERMENAATGLGISYEKVYTWPDTIELLKDGKIIIALMGEQSLFTSTGHFIVLKGISEDGLIFVNDPWGGNYTRYPNEFENGFEQWQVIKGYRGGWVFG